MASVTVHLCRSQSRWPLRRPQRWHLRVVAANGRILVSSETYTNYGDALATARLLFDPSTTVALHGPNGDEVLRG